MLIRLDFSGHRHRHQGTSMISIVESDNGRSPCGITGDLDRVFDSLCAAVQKDRFLLEIAWSQVNETFGESNIRFVHHHAKAGMREIGRLFCNGPGDLWPSMSNIHHTDAACEVDIAIAINIFNHSSISFCRKYVHGG